MPKHDAHWEAWADNHHDGSYTVHFEAHYEHLDAIQAHVIQACLQPYNLRCVLSPQSDGVHTNLKVEEQLHLAAEETFPYYSMILHALRELLKVPRMVAQAPPP